MAKQSESTEVLRIDTRGLRPPEPMVRILSLLDRLGPRWSGRIEARLDRRPLFLFPELEERELQYTCEPSNDGGYLVTIRRSSP